jgi:hypothetical protein
MSAESQFFHSQTDTAYGSYRAWTIRGTVPSIQAAITANFFGSLLVGVTPSVAALGSPTGRFITTWFGSVFGL